MDMVFDFDQRQGVTNVHFEGLDGTEGVTSMKQALSLLKIRNPATTFVEALERLEYDDATDEEYNRMLDTIEFLRELWRYPDQPGEAPAKYEMNALTLLANAIEALSQLNAKCRMRD